jgi:hypothetical protein
MYPVFTFGEEQKTLSDNDSVGSLEEVRRGVESKPYHESLEEIEKQGKSQVKKDLEAANRKITEMKPKWLTNKVIRSLAKVLIVGIIAFYILKSLQRSKKKKARDELKNIQEETRKNL